MSCTCPSPFFCIYFNLMCIAFTSQKICMGPTQCAVSFESLKKLNHNLMYSVTVRVRMCMLRTVWGRQTNTPNIQSDP